MANEFTEDAATTEIDLPRRAPLLLGTFGPENELSALVRLPDGEVQTIIVGDTVLRANVQAISEGRLALARNGEITWLEVPG